MNPYHMHVLTVPSLVTLVVPAVNSDIPLNLNIMIHRDPFLSISLRGGRDVLDCEYFALTLIKSPLITISRFSMGHLAVEHTDKANIDSVSFRKDALR